MNRRTVMQAIKAAHISAWTPAELRLPRSKRDRANRVAVLTESAP